MVEAVPVLMVMTLFLGLTMYTFRSYHEKLSLLTRTRVDALTESSSACAGSKSGNETSTGSSLSGQASGIADRMSGGKTSNTMMVKTVTRTASATVKGTLAVDLKKEQVSRKVTAWSEVTCRPKPEGWGDMFSGGLGGLRGMVGL